MAENGVLKIGKVTGFQAHQIEHQPGAYTGCNHGRGLAVIHPVLYRHLYKAGAARFSRFAQNVWDIALIGCDKATALAGIEALAAFIREIGLPTTFAELGKKYGKSAAQIILRWHIQDGNIVIPGSKNPDHIKVNFDLFDFALTGDEMARIAALNQDRRYYTSTPELLKKYAQMVPPVDAQK